MVLSNFQEGKLDKEYWNTLKTIFIQTAPKLSYQIWYYAPHLFYYNKKHLSKIFPN